MGNGVRLDLDISMQVQHACVSRLNAWYLRKTDSIIIKRMVDLGFFVSVG